MEKAGGMKKNIVRLLSMDSIFLVFLHGVIVYFIFFNIVDDEKTYSFVDFMCLCTDRTSTDDSYESFRFG